jgi:hypothetical protein
VSTCSCGCCAGVEQRTPLTVENRPGLSAVAYRVGVHSDFLASMIAGLSSSSRPGLRALGTRDEDDFTIALLDAWAVAADVLAFYNERLAQESYLRTARQRISLQELGKLIGYQLDPGTAAQAYVAFALQAPPDLPPAATVDPGSAPPVTPTSVTLKPGLRMQSIPGPGETPQTFETVEEVEARPEWNAMPASPTLPHLFGLGDTTAYFDTTTLNLAPGDAILLKGSDILDEQWDLRVLTAVETRPELNSTRVDWLPGLGSVSPHVDPAPTPDAYVLRKRLDVFGHNAPEWKAMSAQFRRNYLGRGVADPHHWPNFTISEKTELNGVDLDGSHPDVLPESWVVLSTPSSRELWQVDTVSELGRAEFAVSGKVTRITLKNGEHYSDFENEVYRLTVFAVSEQLELVERENPDPVTDDWLDVDEDVGDMAPGRPLVVRGTTTDKDDFVANVVVKSVVQDGKKWRITFEDDLGATLERDTVIVHGNVALATHGETVQELLGSGRASAPFQRFSLSHDPLTYVQSSSDPSGKVDTLDVRINDVSWHEAPTLYGTGARDRDFAVRVDENGRTTVQFGDGVDGARLPTGVNNVRAVYRKGLGAAGNVDAGKLAQLVDMPLGVKGVSNPLAAKGGVDPVGVDSARTTIPLGVRTLGRAVSLLDYSDFALAFSGVAKASAAVLPLRAGQTIVVTVAFEGGERIDDLTTSLKTFGDPHVHVVVLEGTTDTFRLAMKVAVEPDYVADDVLTAVDAALHTAYSFDAREFVEPVFLSAIEAVAHGVPGVLAVDVDRLYAGSTPGRSDRLLAPQPAVASNGTAVPAGVLVLASGPFDWLVKMT